MRYIVLSFFALLMAAAPSYARYEAPSYENLEETFQHQRQQLDAAFAADAPPPTPKLVTNKEYGFYRDDFRIGKKVPPYKWDVEIMTYSAAFAEKNNMPKHLVSPDMPKGMQILTYSQFSLGDEVECLLKFAIDEELGGIRWPEYVKPSKIFFIPLISRMHAPEMRRLPAAYKQEMMKGVYVVPTGTFEREKKGPTYYSPNRGFIPDERSSTSVYIVKAPCAPSNIKRYENGFSLYVTRQKYKDVMGMVDRHKFLQFPVPKAFSNMMTYLMKKIK